VRNDGARDVGVQLIVVYKAVKSIAEVLLAAALVALAATGELDAVRQLAMRLRDEYAGRISLLLGRTLLTVFSVRGVRLLQVGFLLDGLLSAVEGWSLWRGFGWGPWLVVVATATPLPLELVEVARRPSVPRVVTLVVNVGIVVYLAIRIARQRNGPRGLSLQSQAAADGGPGARPGGPSGG
jgi:uncharacterized membrane protein (DUF2068 family)